ncbi:MAG TPA: hypothetical protein VLB67_01740 [Acidimicrobiia bacterium]|nr:hypothetical protein [Acidimicrobiia bacterium]
MRTRIFLLALSLAVMFGGPSALADEHVEGTTANTGFVATIDDETNYIKYFVCSLDEEADDFCDTTLDEFDASSFGDWTGEIEVEPNGAGEFNHGSYVSAFATGYEGAGKGCLVRHIAQSDWGKEGFDLSGEDVLVQAMTSCSFNAERGNGNGNGNGNGKPEWAGQGKPPWAGPDGDKSLKPGKGGNG